MYRDLFRRPRPVTALLVTVGLLLGLTAALVWHVAADAPDWWPTLPLLAGLGAGVGGFVAACANAEGWRMTRAQDGGYRPLAVLTTGTALVSGVCFAWAWTASPPSSGAASPSPWLTFPLLSLVVAAVAAVVAFELDIRVFRLRR
ncbi:hypothetical protein [Prescottella subtropica]|uniref:hypothetical protein n=1 Tax=Prescottella subtropica TaxID=2545757 RepID=UPI0010F85DFC|nr:hypothetical protein [Prescottella subtropica]